MLDTRPEHIWIDGQIKPAAGPHLAVGDRGFQLGDGLFETMRARRGVVIEWDEHRARLREGAAVLEIGLPDDEELEAGIRELLRVEHLSGPGDDRIAPGDASVRITVSRGTLDRRGLLPAEWRSARPTVVIQVWPHVPPPDRLLADGARAIISGVRRDPSSPLAGIKATSRADHVFARLEAERAGADDALFLTIDGRVSEATSANVFAIADGRLVTPPRSEAILAGTTRTWLLGTEATRAIGLRTEEHGLTPTDLTDAEEAFLCSSIAGLVPLVALDRRPIGDGRPGPRTLALRAERERWIDEASLAGGGRR